MSQRLFTPAEVNALIPRLTELMNEAKELLAIFTKSAKTASASRQ